MSRVNIELLRDLSNQMQARSQGVLALFKARGVEVDRPSLAALNQAVKRDPSILRELHSLLNSEVANADDWTSWAAGIGSAVEALFTTVGKDSTSTTDEAALAAAAKAQAEAESAKKSAWMWVGVAVAAVVVVIIVVVVIKKRK